jgi:hypothetical protein
MILSSYNRPIMRQNYTLGNTTRGHEILACHHATPTVIDLLCATPNAQHPANFLHNGREFSHRS